MHIEIIDAQNSGRNYNYLVACLETKQALAIDPIAVDACLSIANKHGWQLPISSIPMNIWIIRAGMKR